MKLVQQPTARRVLAQAMHDAGIGHSDEYPCAPYHLDPDVPYPFPGEAEHERWRMHWDGAALILSVLAPGWELSQHIHDWRTGPTLASNPPIETRQCSRCGKMEKLRPAEWLPW